MEKHNEEQLRGILLDRVQEVDGSWYWWPKGNLKDAFIDTPKEIGRYIQDFEYNLEQTYYIKNNWLVFLLDGVGYVWFGSNTAAEWDEIRKLQKFLNEKGAEWIYCAGELD